MHSILRASILGLAAGIIALVDASALSCQTRAEAPCLTTDTAHEAELVRIARQFGRDPWPGSRRVALGIPIITPDSIALSSDRATRDSAATVYQRWRVVHHEPSIRVPFMLVRLGNSGYYLGTAFIRRESATVEYVVFDSNMTIAGTVAYIR